jgi:hypothetical protein
MNCRVEFSPLAESELRNLLIGMKITNLDWVIDFWMLLTVR